MTQLLARTILRRIGALGITSFDDLPAGMLDALAFEAALHERRKSDQRPSAFFAKLRAAANLDDEWDSEAAAERRADQTQWARTYAA